MEWAQVLVIILSVFLAIFLLLAIVLTVILIRLTKQIRDVTSSAQRTVESVEKTVTTVSNVASPVFLAKFVSDQVKRFKSK